ncbi:MAG: hypothetical protein KKF98_00645 [Bacteroidetes bacterium]|nr:hypothetical protein [Bacteroidota bacterium]
MKRIFIRLVLIILSCSISMYADEPLINKKKPWYIPQSFSIQYAGHIGFLSVGTGTQFFKGRLLTSLMYGYVPKSIGKTNIHLITLKNVINLGKKSGADLSFTPYLGHTLSYETGNNSFLRLPDKYPKGYYTTNAFHFTVFAGGKIHKDFSKLEVLHGIDFYTELGTVDTYLWYFIRSKEVALKDIVSAAIGINVYF